MFHRKFLPGEAENKPAHWAKPCPAVSWGNLVLAGFVCVGFLHSLVCHSHVCTLVNLIITIFYKHSR